MNVSDHRRLFAVLCGVAAVGCIAASFVFFATGFAGPAPIGLVAGGGFIAAAVALWRPPPRR